MAKKLAFERYYWFHLQIKRKKYPNAADVARHFEVSRKTAYRDISFMADRLGAPLEYDPQRRGYYYSDELFELPAIWLEKEQVIALVLAKRLAAAIPDKKLKSQLQDFITRLAVYLPVGKEANVDKMGKKISIKNVEYYDVEEKLFNQVLQSLLGDRTVQITYYSPHKNEKSERRIFPLHLLNYMGNWHLIAFCGRTMELRDFALSRILKLENSDKKLSLPRNLPSIKDYLEKQFGIFSGEGGVEVTLRFSPEASRWVREQIWHPKQKSSMDGKGRLSLSFPVADFRELKREVLKFGAEAEVLKPSILRREVSEEISKMARTYKRTAKNLVPSR